MTHNITDDYLRDRAYYRGRFIDRTIDNPDQRIQQDITDFTQTSVSLSMGAVSAVVSIFSFTKILWDLSGPLNILGVEVPRAMMFLVLTYVLVTTVVAFWIGRPLIRLNFLNERFNANFRYALVRLRDSAENVAFYRGEQVERVGLFARFRQVIRNYWDIVFRTLKFSGWNLVVNQTAELFPLVIQAPRFFAGTITLGDVTQTSTAFRNVHDSLSFFRESYDDFAGYRASLIRLNGLMEASEASRDLPSVSMAELDNALELDNIDVRKPDGEVLIDDLSLRLSPGDALVVKGASGSGKTTLLRTLAQMWPFGDGEIRRPVGSETLFLSQIPYIPLGDLRTAVCYPVETRGGRRRTAARDAAEGQPRAPAGPPRRGAGLGEDPLSGRAAAGRVRPDPAAEAKTGVPRRGDLSRRRGARVLAVRADPRGGAGNDARQRRAPQHRRPAPHAAAGTRRHRVVGALAGGLRRHGYLRVGVCPDTVGPLGVEIEP